VVVGGGNTAVEEALFLTKFASSVTLVHRRSELRAERILQTRLLENPRVRVLFDTVLIEVLGSGSPPGVTSVQLRNVRTARESKLPAHGVFIAIGHSPASDLFAGQLERTPSGYIEVNPGSIRTSIPGVFAVGDVVDDAYRQAVTAAGMGCRAALEAIRFLDEMKHGTQLGVSVESRPLSGRGEPAPFT
jgi:thioredoxin reductase (NADPH)